MSRTSHAVPAFAFFCLITAGASLFLIPTPAIGVTGEFEKSCCGEKWCDDNCSVYMDANGNCWELGNGNISMITACWVTGNAGSTCNQSSTEAYDSCDNATGYKCSPVGGGRTCVPGSGSPTTCPASCNGANGQQVSYIIAVCSGSGC
jgi:hypothetical protein